MTGSKAVQLVGSGNGLRRNVLLRELVEERFRMPVKIPGMRRRQPAAQRCSPWHLPALRAPWENYRRKSVI